MQIAKLKIAVIGLGYVGLPSAVESEKKVPTLSFNSYHECLDELKIDHNHLNMFIQERKAAQLSCYIASLNELKSCKPLITTVHISIDYLKKTYLTVLCKVSTSISQTLKSWHSGYESTECIEGSYCVH